MQRMKVPPALNQFNCPAENNMTIPLFHLLAKYKPESEKEKAKRLHDQAEKTAAGEVVQTKKPILLKFGLGHVTELVEMNKAKLVVIAHDVDPIELVVWLPTLCRKKNIPYVIVKSKARLGQLVHQKTAACVALETVSKGDQSEFENICKNARTLFNDNVEMRRRWGGGIMGIKSQHVEAKREAVIRREDKKKMTVNV
eukprot:GHVO01042932.1.p2 GENE.GHVO01042932.1~~GHVO01042932.1.p2  ORF type:complete len:198 (+),score=39.67 GHVO01042932.1:294-887(+)